MEPSASNSSLPPELPNSGELAPSAQSASASDPSRSAEPTIAHTPSRPVSRGLHIRCPHCSNGVELLADTPYEEITCRSCGSTFNLVQREDLTRAAASLKTIGRFELVARLGVGGFGTVWKARDTELDRTVAVKIPRSGQLAATEVEQFYREARAAAQLRHPNIVSVHEVGVVDVVEIDIAIVVDVARFGPVDEERVKVIIRIGQGQRKGTRILGVDNSVRVHIALFVEPQEEAGTHLQRRKSTGGAQI